MTTNLSIASLALSDPTWLRTFQELLHYYLPPFDRHSPALNVGSLVAVVAGVFLAFRCARYERGVVCMFALLLGAWAGFRVSLLIDSPGPISAAVGAVAVAVIGYRTYRWWLAAGSVVVLFSLAMLFQLGRGDLQRYLPAASASSGTSTGDQVQLRTPEEQARNLYPAAPDQLAKFRERVVAELGELGIRGWLLPALAGIVGLILAIWALRTFAVVWIGLLGAAMAIMGLSTFVGAHWPDARAELIARPQFTAYAIAGLWLLGLILQAKEARFPRKKPAAGGGDKPAPRPA
jgi:hypothetical protein